MSDRMSSFNEFWPYYLSEHRLPSCRWVHFIGTSGFVGYVMWLIWQEFQSNHFTLILTLSLALLGGWFCFQMEAKRNAVPALLGMIGMITWSNPAVLYGVLFAYFWAWVGHFLIEHNRPATFLYPLWSLAGDFRMWGEMWRGRLWTTHTPEAFYQNSTVNPDL